MKLCLNMIVKNEAARIERALASAVQFIDSYAITDTGSTDDTVAVIKDFFKAHGIWGFVFEAPFKNWSQARNSALASARQSKLALGWDYALLMDADMELVVNDRAAFFGSLRGDGCMTMEQRSAALRYQNARIISNKATGWYKGVTHEYLDVPCFGAVPNTAAFFLDHADGANRPEKYKRDIALLLEGLKEEPENYRYYFYLAQSYRDAGDVGQAIYWYQRRVKAGGWEEEQWNAQLNLANCYKDLGQEGDYVVNMLKAYQMRPSRAESLWELAHYFRNKGGTEAIASVFAEAGLDAPYSTDSLFVNDYVHKVGAKEEFGITGFYVPHKRAKAFQITDELTQRSDVPENARECARNNLYFYLPTLKDICPSFEWRDLGFKPEEGWVPLNPSIAWFGDHAECIVRTVNYRIDEHGRYLIRGPDETVNNSNPINTRNFLLRFSGNPMTYVPSAMEILAPGDLPLEYKWVVGFEDMRLFNIGGERWTSSTVRQFAADGQCEQVLARLVSGGVEGQCEITDVKRMLRTPRETEKNWSYIPRTKTEFMWRPGTIVNEHGVFTRHNPPRGINVDNISGSSQLVELPQGGYLAIVHSARHIPGKPTRYYYHRFIHYTENLSVRAISKPFVFNDKVIEFCAGMCLYTSPDSPAKDDSLLISYGYKDCEARLGIVSLGDVMRMIWKS